jgi:ribonuclease Z
MWNNGEVLKIPNTCYTLKGFSIAALRTNFFIPELKVMLDGGLSANLAPENILITHGHSDHVANLPYHLYTANEKRINIFTPAESYLRINRYIEAAFAMSIDCDENDESFRTKLQSLYELFPSFPGRTEIFVNGNRSMGLEIIPCDHSVPSIGFGLIEKRLKLKPEYSHLQGKEIGQLKKSGIEINYEVEFPFFLYLGDTSEKVLLNENILKYKTIMIECTFILDDELEQAGLTKHIHWQYLKPFILAHPEIYFILYHFSQRYKPEEIQAFFEPLRHEIPNFHAWISS